MSMPEIYDNLFSIPAELILIALKRLGGSATGQEIYCQIVDDMGFSDREKLILDNHRHGLGLNLDFRMQSTLVAINAIEELPNGVWVLTEKGRVLTPELVRDQVRFLMAPGTVRSRIITNADRLYRLQMAELGELFGFQTWSMQRREMVSRLLAIKDIAVQPSLDRVRDDDWIELSTPEPVKEQYSIRDDAYGGPSTYEVVVLASTLGPLVTAFCTELGKRLGGTVADWISRVRVARRPKRPEVADIVVDDGVIVTSLEITSGMTDEAKLALLDLDISDKAIRGKSLRWDNQEKAWSPVKAE